MKFQSQLLQMKISSKNPYVKQSQVPPELSNYVSGEEIAGSWFIAFCSTINSGTILFLTCYFPTLNFLITYFWNLVVSISTISRAA